MISTPFCTHHVSSRFEILHVSPGFTFPYSSQWGTLRLSAHTAAIRGDFRLTPQRRAPRVATDSSHSLIITPCCGICSKFFCDRGRKPNIPLSFQEIPPIHISVESAMIHIVFSLSDGGDNLASSRNNRDRLPLESLLRSLSLVRQLPTIAIDCQNMRQMVGFGHLAYIPCSPGRPSNFSVGPLIKRQTSFVLEKRHRFPRSCCNSRMIRKCEPIFDSNPSKKTLAPPTLFSGYVVANLSKSMTKPRIMRIGRHFPASSSVSALMACWPRIPLAKPSQHRIARSSRFGFAISMKMPPSTDISDVNA